MEFLPAAIVGLAITMTGMFLFRLMGWGFSRRNDAALPRNLTLERAPDALRISYRWAGAWNYVMLALFSAAAALLAFDALRERSRYPITIGGVLVFAAIVLPIGYALLVTCLNRTLFTITPSEIIAATGPLPAATPDVRMRVADLTRIVVMRDIYGSLKIFAVTRTGPDQTLSDSHWEPDIPLALARLIREALPGLPVDIDGRQSRADESERIHRAAFRHDTRLPPGR